MSEGFAYIDILIFAMVAAFIALRLRSVLGRRTGHERRRTEEFSTVRNHGARDNRDNVVPMTERVGPPAPEDQAIAGLVEGDLKTALTEISRNDPEFDLRQFLSGASLAFEMIVESYAAGDKDSLRPLLAELVFRGFAQAIDDRQAAEQTLDTQLIAVREPLPLEASLDGTVAKVVLRFNSEQVNILRDRVGVILEGDPNTAEEVIDIWTFERDTRSEDPNWILTETRTPN
jgi:predicted lipid-binding transport protein (Tim44 family)